MIIQSREIQDFSWNFFPYKVSRGDGPAAK